MKDNESLVTLLKQANQDRQTDDAMVPVFMGKPIREMEREELIEVAIFLGTSLQLSEQRCSEIQNRGIRDSLQKALQSVEIKAR